jgi:hypothetical protein
MKARLPTDGKIKETLDPYIAPAVFRLTQAKNILEAKT